MSEPKHMNISWRRNILNFPFGLYYFVISLLQIVVYVLMPRKMFKDIQDKQHINEVRSRLDNMENFVKAGDKVLDVGCGNGRFGEKIAEKFGAEVCGVDVVDYADASIQIDLYDGHRLPFEDNSFDVVVMAFMLHHVAHQEDIFKEAVRCSRRGIVVFEDTYYSPWQRLFVIWNDFYSNMVVGLVKIIKGTESRGVLSMPLPFTFRSVKGWCKFFDKHSMVVKDVAVRHSSNKPLTKVTFCLAKD